MGLSCNLDPRGRKLRLIGGAILDGLGAGLLVAGAWRGAPWLVGGGIVAMLAGSFMVCEGAIGWCALRALGFKTKL